MRVRDVERTIAGQDQGVRPIETGSGAHAVAGAHRSVASECRDHAAGDDANSAVHVIGDIKRARAVADDGFGLIEAGAHNRTVQIGCRSITSYGTNLAASDQPNAVVEGVGHVDVAVARINTNASWLKKACGRHRAIQEAGAARAG